MAVAVTFGHSWASAVFYNFSVIKLDHGKQESVSWDNLDYKKACAERGKRDAVLSFDVHDDLCTVLRKGKPERTVPTADIVSCTEDESCPKTLTLQFAPPEDPKKQKKFVEFERFECWNRFDRQIIRELIDHAKGNDGSIADLEDSFPKQTIHHSVLQIRQKSSFDAKYCVLVKWKLYIYDDWYSKNTSASVCLMGVDVTKDPKDKKKLQIMTSPVPTYVRCNDEEERDFWYEMLLNSASMEMPSMEEHVAEVGMDWDLFDELMETIAANDEELDELEFADPDLHLNEEQAFRLAEALMTPNTNVRRLDLCCNQMLGDDGVNAISELLLDNLNCVEDLAMMGCELHDHGLEMICAHLGKNTTCKSLDLAHNGITDSGIELLASTLAENTTLKDLDVAGNQLTDVGYGTLARELAKNASLTRVSLATTEPSEEGLCSLAEALKTNETLEELHLEDISIPDAARAKLSEMLTANHKVTITGVEPPIERPLPPKPVEPEPSAPEPEPEPEPQPKPKPKPKRKPPAPMQFDAQGNLIRNFKDPDLLHDGKLGGADKGEGFMGMLNMWRDAEVISERKEEMSQADPLKRAEIMKRFEEEDAKKGRARGTKKAVPEGVPPSNDVQSECQTSGRRVFGVRIEDLEMMKTSEGQQVPKVLFALKEKIGDASTPQVFLKAANESAKNSARASLDGGSDNWGDDPHVAANLLLDWFGEYPGGVLASLSDEMQQKMGDDEDGALKALEQLPEALQEALTLLIDIANTAVINASNGVGLDEIAGKVADFISPVPSKDDGQLFIYWLLVFWSQNA